MAEDCVAASTRPTFLSLVNDVPVVRSALEKTSSAYNAAKGRNFLTKIGLGAAEMSLNTALATTKLAYHLMPSCGVFGRWKEGINKKVEQVDSLACYGLQCVQKICPIIMEDTDEVVATGTEKLEKSVVLESLLAISEAFLDYIQPDKLDKDETNDECDKNQNSNGVKITTRTQTKLHRIKSVSHKAKLVLEETVIGGGRKALYFAVSVPGVITKTGLHGVKTVLEWTWDTIGETQRGRILRRSRRRKGGVDYHCLLSSSNPFPVDKKRKRSDPENAEEGITYELLYVDENYVSEEDPDFNPTEEVEAVSDSETTDEESGEGSLEEGELNDITRESEANSSQVLTEPEMFEPVESADPGVAGPHDENLKEEFTL